MIAYTNKGKTVSDFILDEPGKFITDLNVSVDRAQDIILAGFYGNEGTVSVIGAFSMKIKANSNKITNKVFHPFERDFLVKNLPVEDARIVQEKIAAGQEFDRYRYRMGDIQLHDNRTFSMIAEQYIEEIRTIGGGTQTATEDHFYDDNMIIITYSPDGNVAWKQKIGKFQFTKHISRHFYSSYALLSNKNKMYFVFNEFPPNKPQRSSAVMVRVNEDGSMERETMFSAEDQKVLQPVTYKITDEKEMYIFGMEGKWNYSLIRPQFN